jgi:hypothetical protein
VVAGPHAVTYFRRHRTMDIQHGRLVVSWSWVVSRVVNRMGAGRAG